jgi:hypothetical protein
VKIKSDGMPYRIEISNSFPFTREEVREIAESINRKPREYIVIRDIDSISDNACARTIPPHLHISWWEILLNADDLKSDLILDEPFYIIRDSKHVRQGFFKRLYFENGYDYLMHILAHELGHIKDKRLIRTNEALRIKGQTQRSKYLKKLIELRAEQYALTFAGRN